MLKKESYEGVLYRRGRAYDAGNWKYSVLYYLLEYISKQTKDEYKAYFEELHRHYTSLDYESHKAYELRGDIIEAALKWARLTGPNHPLREVHREFHDCVRSACDALEAVDLQVTEDGIPPGRERLRAQTVAKLIMCCHGIDSLGNQVEDMYSAQTVSRAAAERAKFLHGGQEYCRRLRVNWGELESARVYREFGIVS